MTMHPRARLHIPAKIGDAAADGVAAVMGSWRFVIIQTAIVIAWIAFNLSLLSRPFDPFPFILLNLLFSTQAAYTAPIIMMSQNRQAAKDRARDDLEAVEVDQMKTISDTLLAINQRQLQFIEEVRSGAISPDLEQRIVERVTARLAANPRSRTTKAKGDPV